MTRSIAPGEAAIRAVGLAKRYGGTLALDGVDFTVESNEIVLLMGDNGSGKTTLLRILAGMTVPDEGTASVLGRDTVRDRTAVARACGTVLDDRHAWYPRLTAAANLEYFAAAAGIPRAQWRPRALEALSVVDLRTSAAKPVAGFSSGMRARLGLARALLADPPVLLLDEPTANMDARSAAALAALLGAQRGRRTVVGATHDPDLAEAVGARVVALDTGGLATAPRSP